MILTIFSVQPRRLEPNRTVRALPGPLAATFNSCLSGTIIAKQSTDERATLVKTKKRATPRLLRASFVGSLMFGTSVVVVVLLRQLLALPCFPLHPLGRLALLLVVRLTNLSYHQSMEI